MVMSNKKQKDSPNKTNFNATRSIELTETVVESSEALRHSPKLKMYRRKQNSVQIKAGNSLNIRPITSLGYDKENLINEARMEADRNKITLNETKYATGGSALHFQSETKMESNRPIYTIIHPETKKKRMEVSPTSNFKKFS